MTVLNAASSWRYVQKLDRHLSEITKVVRTALQNASSIASLLLTTEALVSELPQKEEKAPAMPPGGGGMY